MKATFSVITVFFLLVALYPTYQQFSEPIRNGMKVKDSGEDVYFNENNCRHRVPSMQTFENIFRVSDITTVSDEVLNSIPECAALGAEASLQKCEGGDGTYLVVNHEKRLVRTEEELSRTFDTTKVMVVTCESLQDVNTGEPLNLA